MVNLEDLKFEAKRILDEGKVKYIIGYRNGSNGLLSSPAFINKSEDIDQLIWDPTCIYNLARLMRNTGKPGKRNPINARWVSL